MFRNLLISIFIISLILAPLAFAQTYQVSKVIDGDTIELSNGEKVYYIGINIPELHHPNKDLEHYAQEAYEVNRKLVEEKEVLLEFDVQERDKYGRLLAYVFVGKEKLFVNAWLVENGYAQVMTIPPNVKYQDLFLSLQTTAREGNKGLWGLETESKNEENTLSETEYIGNKSTKKFHLPGCSSVNDMKDSNRVYFSSREEAIETGYIPCKRCHP